MITEARQDPVVQAALGIKKSIDQAVDLEKIMEEARVLQASRTSRRLYKIAFEPSSLSEATLRDLAVRSRLAELRGTLDVHHLAMTTALERCSDHVFVVFADDIQNLATNAADRKRLVNKILAPMVAKVAEIAAATSLLELFLKDLDQASYLLRNATDNLKMIVERRVNTL